MLAATSPYYPVKHRMHGMNLQVIASPDGTIIWTSGSMPDSTHDLTAARIWGILRALAHASVLTLTGRGLPRRRRTARHTVQGPQQAPVAEGGQPLPYG